MTSSQLTLWLLLPPLPPPCQSVSPARNAVKPTTNHFLRSIGKSAFRMRLNPFESGAVYWIVMATPCEGRGERAFGIRSVLRKNRLEVLRNQYTDFLPRLHRGMAAVADFAAVSLTFLAFRAILIEIFPISIIKAETV